MGARIGILSRGLWAIRDDVARLTGMEPVFVPAAWSRSVEAVAGNLWRKVARRKEKKRKEKKRKERRGEERRGGG